MSHAPLQPLSPSALQPSLPRLSALYQPSGRAREYADWALNLYTGCTNRCLYCYAPKVTHQTSLQFMTVKPRADILAKLEHDLATLLAFSVLHPSAVSLPSSVHLCFTCDPYQPLERTAWLTHGAIELLHRAGVGAQLLTKCADLATRDFDLLSPADSFGTTLTFPSESPDSRVWELNADPPHVRMAALKEAHKRGIRTWCSLEPVIDPAHALAIIDLTHDYVDFYRVGPLNYFPEFTKDIDWRQFALDVTARFAQYGSRYELKQALRSLLPQ